MFKNLLVSSAEDRFFMGIEVESGRYFLSIPVRNPYAEYNEYYEITEVEFKLFSSDLAEVRAFAESCRNRKEDDRLIQKPGRLRGEPI